MEGSNTTACTLFLHLAQEMTERERVGGRNTKEMRKGGREREREKDGEKYKEDEKESYRDRIVTAYGNCGEWGGQNILSRFTL